MARIIRRGAERVGCEQGDEYRYRYAGADRWRRACRPDPRHGFGLARRRCHGRRASPGRGAAERQVQFDLRPLGLATKLRGAGLPADHPNDVVSRTTATGIELCRIGIPSRAERYGAIEGSDTSWPTPEPPHRINQIYFEPILFAHAAAQS